MLRMRRAILVALALSLALISGAFAADNAGVTFSLASANSVQNVGAGETIDVSVTASGMTGVKKFRAYVRVSDAANYDLAETKISGLASLQSAIDLLNQGKGLVTAADANVVEISSGVLSGAGESGDLTFTITLTTSASFTNTTESTISFDSIVLGTDANDPAQQDTFATAVVSDLTVSVNPPVSDPTLTASTATDVSTDYSAVGSGAAADGSDGEVSVGVSFADATGAAAAGQSIAFAVMNNGSEMVYVNGTGLAAGASRTVNVSTDGSGNASILLDAEGDKFAGSTSASVTATTSADNSEGTSLALSASFAVTWDVPVPAELAAFAGSITPQSQVVLTWAVPTQSNNLGWEVYRSLDNESFEQVGEMVAGEGTVNELRTYEFLDEELPMADFVYYYLRQVDFDGSGARSQTIEVALSSAQALPTAMSLLQNYPNPFNPETSIRFDLATQANVSVRIYDITGQVVRTLVSGLLPAGSYTELWDGRSDSGIRVGSGVYFYELQAGTFTSMKKMTLVQ